MQDDVYMITEAKHKNDDGRDARFCVSTNTEWDNGDR